MPGRRCRDPEARDITPAERLKRIEYEFAQSILLSEMLDSLTVVPQPKDDPLPRSRSWPAFPSGDTSFTG